MTKRVLTVGHCGFDHANLRALVEKHFDAEVLSKEGLDDALAALHAESFDLVLVNRRFVHGGEGMELIRALKRDEQRASVPAMLITNFVEHQQTAQREGAEPGFGKAELAKPATVEKLRRFLA